MVSEQPSDADDCADERSPVGEGPDRRALMHSLGVGLVGTGIGVQSMTTEATAETRTSGIDFEPKTWQSDAVPETPIRQLSFPGTHHAAMVNPDPASPEYWDCQTRDVYTQLCDGIRFLDVRVESQGDGDDTVFYGHHGTDTGRSLDDEVLPQIAQYLDELATAGGSELVLLKLSHFYDSGVFSDDEFEADDWRELSALLEETVGQYAVDLSAYSSPGDFLDETLSSFDGPRIAVFHRTLKEHDSPLSLPSFTAPFESWVSSYYPDTPTPGNVLAGGVTNTHTSQSKLGETQWIIRAPADLYTDGQATNEMLTLYEQVARADPDINPNIIRVDYYETSPVVSLCRQLSLDGLHQPPTYTPSLPAGVYSLHSDETGNVVEVADGDESDGANVEEAPWTDSAHQRIRVERNDDATYRLEATHTGKVLDVADAGTDDAANIIQWPWNGGANQRWYAVELGDGTYSFINANSGRVLDGEQPGTNVHQWHWEDDPNQQWDLTDR